MHILGKQVVVLQHKGRLHLKGDNTGDLYVRYENDTNVNAYVFQDQSDSNNLKLELTNDIAFNTNGANERMVINSASGRVGIGTDPTVTQTSM